MIKLTVYFDEPFWVGVFEYTENKLLQTSRVVFGSEPKDYEVYEFLMKNFYRLHFGKAVNVTKTPAKKINPKRIHKQISRELKEKNISTKAQQAIASEQESRKLERKHISKEEKEFEKQQRFRQHQEKKKEKKKGH